MVANRLEIKGGVSTLWLALSGFFVYAFLALSELQSDAPSRLESYKLSCIKVCGALDSQESSPNLMKLAKDVYALDLIATSNCKLG